MAGEKRILAFDLLSGVGLGQGMKLCEGWGRFCDLNIFHIQ
jgi:hypothetical protein